VVDDHVGGYLLGRHPVESAEEGLEACRPRLEHGLAGVVGGFLAQHRDAEVDQLPDSARELLAAVGSGGVDRQG
jgi:hypothetical protein